MLKVDNIKLIEKNAAFIFLSCYVGILSTVWLHFSHSESGYLDKDSNLELLPQAPALLSPEHS